MGKSFRWSTPHEIESKVSIGGLMLDRLIAVINKFDEISDWSISQYKQIKHELYLIFDKTEAQRKVETDNFSFTLFVDKEVNGKKMRGSAYQTISTHLTDEELESLVADTVFAASLGLNPHFELAEKEESEEEYPACDMAVFENPEKAIIQMKDELYNAVAKEDGIKMSSAEFFITCSDTKSQTSKGVNYSEKKTRILMEMVLLASDENDTTESWMITTERYLENLNISELVQEYSDYARSNLKAKLPQSGKFDVIFTGEALGEFFGYYVSQASGSSAYYKSGKFNIGDEVVKDAEGDKLNIFSDPELKGGLKTNKYDGYGTLLKKFPMYKNGKLVNLAANQQFANYLEIPATGSSTNIVVQPGEKGIDELIEDSYILSRFSTFSPNPVTGAFSGEIRNGYFFKDGKKQFVKGGSVTGLMDIAMKNVYFSKETIQTESYFGPKYIKVCNLDIAGE